MAEDGYLDVRWVGGPYDGSAQPLQELHRYAQFVDMPDPAVAYNEDPSSEPAIFTGPTHRYRLSVDGGALTATHVGA